MPNVSCSSCGHAELRRDGTCPECGAQACPECGAARAAQANFCSQCGFALAGLTPRVSARAAPIASAASPGEHALARVMASRLAFEGERKLVSVLFADLRGSLSVIEGVDPEEVQALLDAVLAAMVEAVHRYEGAVSQTMGDGILALFGAPLAHEDHALRACCAALAMQEAVRRMQDASWKARGREPVIRVGVHSGEVAVRAVHNDLSMEYRAVGSTTHIASRMEQLASPGKVWVTAETVRLCRGLLRTRGIGPVQVKGVTEPIEAFELVGISTRTRFQANALRGLSPLVGREAALRVLTDALARAHSGQTTFAVVSGEPGIGKSRLCYEVMHHAGDGYRVVEAAAASYGQLTSHGVLANLARALLGIEDDDAIPELTHKVGSWLQEHGLHPAPHLPVLLELLGVPSRDAALARMDPVQRKRHVELTLQSMLTGFCSQGPSILLFEDLHWCDADSLAFISKLIVSPPMSHALFLLTHRPGMLLPAADLPHVLRCEISGLEAADSHALLASLLGSHASSTELRMRLLSRTVGNPFFIEESVRTVMDAGMLRALPAGTREHEQINVPDSIDALLGARLDRLPEALLEMLQAAAVIGDHSQSALLREVLALAPDVFQANLRELAQADLLYESVQLRAGNAAPAPVFRFKHALIHEVVYKRLVRGRRRSLHARVVDAMELQFKERLNEHAARLAEHAERAERWEACVRYHTQACIRAASFSSNAQALEHLERGLEALSRVAPGSEHDRLAIDLRLRALAPLLPLGAHERAIELLTEAERYAQGLNDTRSLAYVANQLGTELWVTAQYESARQKAEDALRLSQQLAGDHAVLSISSRYVLASVHHARGELPEALALFRELASMFSGDAARKRLGWPGYPSVFTRTMIISVLSLLGGFSEAERVFQEGLRYADALEHAFSRTMLLEQYGMCLLVSGDAPRAVQLLREALETCERDEVNTMITPVGSHLGLALLRVGELSEAERVIERAATEHTELAGHYALGYLAIAQSELYLARGERLRAGQIAQTAMQDTARHGERAFHVRARLQYAASLLADPLQLQAAEAEYTEALAQALALGMPPWAALAHTGVAEVRELRGDQAGAQDAGRAAVEIWRQLEAPRRVAELRRFL